MNTNSSKERQTTETEGIRWDVGVGPLPKKLRSYYEKILKEFLQQSGKRTTEMLVAISRAQKKLSNRDLHLVLMTLTCNISMLKQWEEWCQDKRK